MKPRLGAFILGGIVVCTFALAQTGGELPENPHGFMDQQTLCPSCHTYWEGQLEPHMFSVMVHDKCKTCHTVLGRSHPINMNPPSTESEIEVPEFLPLAYIDELGDDVMSCGTCHNPHGEWLAEKRAYPSQLEEIVITDASGQEVKYFKTFYLRISDPVEGYMPLCVSCHLDY